MNIDNISAGKNPPTDINVIIEIPARAGSIKYEIDKDSGAVVVDRFIPVAMYYPLHYGFMPHTIGGDDDPIDVLVLSEHDLVPGCVVRCRPIGVLNMEDESGQDEKIIAVPHSKLSPRYDSIDSIEAIDDLLRSQIKHFFEHYKDLESGKWVKLSGWQQAAHAHALIKEGLTRAAP